MMGTRKILEKIGIVCMAMTAGVMIGDRVGNKLGYEKGKGDQMEATIETVDSIKKVYGQRAADFIKNADTIRISITTYTLTPKR